MSEDADRDEMKRLLAYANYSKVADAIGVKRAAVSNWANGRNVTVGRLEQVRSLFGTTKEPRPDVPDGADAPAWAERLTDKILGEIRMIRDESVESAVRAIADRLGPQILAELAPEGEDQPPPKPAGRGASPR